MNDATKAVAGIIFNDEGQLLTLKRGTKKSLPNLWHLPGGKLNFNEDHMIALSRELEEELGIVVVVGVFFAKLNFEYKEGRYNLAFFKIQSFVGNPSIQTEENQGMAWIDEYNLEKISTYKPENWLPLDYWVAKLAFEERKHSGVR